MKRILIISFSDLRSDPRVRRQLFALKERYCLTAAGLADPGISGVEFLPAIFAPVGILTSLVRALSLKLRCFEQFYKEKHALPELRSELKKRRFDLIIANDIDALPFALDVASGAKVFLDCHEYAPLEFEDQFRWRFFFQCYKEYLCRTYLKRCDVVTTVCEGIAEEYRRTFGIRPPVVTNAADYVNIEPSPVAENRFRLIHHGGALPSRRIEVMIRMMDFLDDRFSLTLMLTKNNPAYYQELLEQVSGNPRIDFREPVAFAEIVQEINQYDVGVYILEPNSFNNKYALPNKFFEFIQARLAVAIGPSPEMARLVKAHDMGIVSDDFEPQSLARLLNGLTREKVEQYKRHTSEAAYELSSAGNRTKILELVDGLIGEDK
jgi:hypothetical protein